MPQRKPKIRFAKYWPRDRWQKGFYTYENKNKIGSLKKVSFSWPFKGGKK